MIFKLKGNIINDSPKNIMRFKIFNEGVKNRRRIGQAEKPKKVGSMTDIAKKLGIKINESFLEEDTLMESKADQQKFIDKFGKEFFDIFWSNKQRLKNKGINVDILWHVKHTSLSDMRKILDSISDEARSQEVDVEGAKLPEPTGNYDVVFEGDEYVVYHPHDYVSSIYCAKGGRWCTAGGYNIPEGNVKVSQAKQYFNQYTGKGVELYYFIKRDGDRYALAVYPNGRNYEVFNKKDERLNDIEEIPGIEDIEIDGLDIESMIGTGHVAECYNCGEFLETDDDVYYSPDNDPMCQYCFDDACFFCSHCGIVFWAEDSVETNDGYMCEECATDRGYVKCDHCGEWINMDYSWIVDDEVYCEECFDNSDYMPCDLCGEIYDMGDMTEIDGEYVCDDCIDSDYRSCDNCGVLTRNYESHNDKILCTDCASEVEED